jgi:hypothetical protein
LRFILFVLLLILILDIPGVSVGNTPPIVSVSIEPPTVGVNETVKIVIYATDLDGISGVAAHITSPDGVVYDVPLEYTGKLQQNTYVYEGNFTNTITAGTYTVSAVAQDIFGNSEMASTILDVHLSAYVIGERETIDVQGPTINTDDIPDITCSQTPTFTSSASDDISTIEEVEFRVEVSDGEWTNWTEAEPSDGSFNEPTEEFIIDINATLSYGDHELEIRATDSAGNPTIRWKRFIVIYCGPQTGSIFISSSPLGADVYLDGSYRGTTPLVVKDVDVGLHRVKVSKPGYKESTDYVYVSAGKRISVQFSLSVQPASIYVLSTPSGANVYLDGEYRGTTPTGLSVSPGSHEIKLTKPGYKDYNTTIFIGAGEIRRIQAKLSEVEVDSDGDGWTDDYERMVGTNPYTKDTDNDGIIDPEDLNPLAPEKKAVCGPTILLVLSCLIILVGKESRRREKSAPYRETNRGRGA